MYRNHSVGVVVPAYNEARFVGEVIETVPPFVDRVYVVDDGSTDETWATIQETAATVNGHAAERTNGDGPFDQRIVPIRHDENRGVGGAIKTGYERARSDRIGVTAVMGGDGQMRPERLTDYLDPIVSGEADYAKGNRLLEESDHADMPRHRLLGNRVLSVLTKVASGYWGIGDPQNGYTAISLTALDAIDIDEMYEFYGYCNDLLVTLNVHGFRVADVPRDCNYADEESHISYPTYVPRVSGMLFSNFCRRLREQYVRGGMFPTGSCYTSGMVIGLFGAVLAATEAVAVSPRSRGVGNGLRTTLLGGAVFLLGAVTERARNADLAVSVDGTDDRRAEDANGRRDRDDTDPTVPEPAD
jgi:glycosyltransferase involved in cell wall biosynthesis